MNKDEKKLNLRYNVMDSNKSFFYVMLVNIISPLVFYVFLIFPTILKAFGISEGAYTDIVGFIQTILISTMFLILLIVFHKKNQIDIKSAVDFDRKINPLYILLIILILGICIVAFFPLINMIYSAIETTGYDASGALGFEMTNWWRLLIGVVIYCVLPSVVEELIFRGIMLKGMLNRAKPIVAITISSFAFFIMHGSLIQSFYQLILGFVLGIICYYTKNIIYPIVFHFLNNLTVVLMGYFNVGGFINGFSLTVGGFFAAIGLAIAGVGAIFGIIVLIRHIARKNSDDKYELVVNENNIILEEKTQKLGFKDFINSFILDEKFYFYSSWIIAIVLWLFNSF